MVCQGRFARILVTCTEPWTQSPPLGWTEMKIACQSHYPTSVTNLTNALVDEWAQNPTAMFQTLVEIFLRRVGAIVATWYFSYWTKGSVLFNMGILDMHPTILCYSLDEQWARLLVGEQHLWGPCPGWNRLFFCLFVIFSHGNWLILGGTAV